MRHEAEGEVVKIMFEVYKFNHTGLKKLMFYNKTSGVQATPPLKKKAGKFLW